ncbi:uncharacterized protein LOC110676128 isoform X2 [Aedes aegypti]|uniref:Uncharacterized protein n=1 Tax=Aedes aegypti TaxID=7159 RepID=A0A6I8U9H6_AEDAE|nr:uncharacterized protein LOC110676128 isoform X2 [Aedes aegypti]
MILNWFCFLVLANFHFSVTLAKPVQKFSPGIPITPAENQIPGKVTGVVGNSATGPGNAVAPSFTQSAAPTTVIRTIPAPTSGIVQPQQVYLQTNPSYYSSPQYVGQTPTAYVYPDGTVRAPPSPPRIIQTGTRFNGNYNWLPAGDSISSGSPSTILSSLVGDSLGLSSSRPSGLRSPIRPSAGQALGALGLLGAGAIGAGALLLG